MEKVIVFFGAGVSKPSCLPLGDELTEKLWHPARKRGEVRYERVRAGETDDVVKVIHEFLSLLEKYHLEFQEWRSDEGFESRSSRDPSYRDPSYEDLFSLADQLRKTRLGTDDDAVPYRFAKWTSEHSDELSARLRETDVNFQEIGPLYTLALETVLYINWIVLDALIGEPNLSSFSLLFELINSYDEVVVATLNHDTLVEQLLDAKDIDYVDGFEKCENGVSWYDPSRFVENQGADVKLLKLHGSINWWRDHGGDHVTYFRHDSEEGRPESDQFQSSSLQPRFLTGNIKEKLYTQGIFADMQREFYLELRDASRMVMSGYGLGDRGINNILKTWLDRGEENMIVRLNKKKGFPLNETKPFGSPFLGKKNYERIDKFFSEGSIEKISEGVENISSRI